MKLLEGIRILDLTEYNTYTTMFFVHYGAEVIRLERPTGEPTSRFYPPLVMGGSPWGHYMSHGKKSFTLGLRTPESKEIMLELVKHVDVIFENFKVGTMEKYGLTYDVLKEINPRLIYASLPGYGTTGPLAKSPAFDNISQAISGLMNMSGMPDGDPTLIGHAVGDHTGSLAAEVAILMALLAREKTGKGQQVEVAMLDTIFSTTYVRGILDQLNGMPAERRGNASLFYAPSDSYRVKDDAYVAIAVTREEQWPVFCDLLGLDDLKKDPALATNDGRMAAYFEKIQPVVREAVKDMEWQQLVKMMKDAGISATKVLTIEEATDAPVTYERDMLSVYPDSEIGPYLMPGRPFHLEGGETRHEPMYPLGAHNAEVYHSIGMTDEEIAELSAKGVI